MVGKRNRKRGLLEALIGPAPTPETLLEVGQRRARASARLAEARELLTAAQRRWLAAFELTLRWEGGEQIDLERAAEHLDSDLETARAALQDLREAFAAIAVEGGGDDLE